MFLRNLLGKEKKGSLWLGPNRIEAIVFLLLLVFLPTQAGRHFWPDFSYVSGIRVDYLSPTLYFTDILLFLLIIFWLVRILRQRKFQPRLNRGQFFKNLISRKPYLFFILFLLVLNVIFAERPMLAILGDVRIVFLVFFSFYIIQNFSYYKYRQILYALSLGVVFESVLAFFQNINQGSLGGAMYFLGEREISASLPGVSSASIMGDLVFRPYGTFSHPNVLAGYLVIVMVLLGSGFIGKPYFRKIFLAPIVIGSIGLFATLSRTAIFFWIIFLLFGRNIKLIAALFAIAVFLLIIGPAGARFRETNFGEEAFLLRKAGAVQSLAIFSENPLFGVGINNYIVAVPKFQTESEYVFGLQPVHNIFLLVLSETGILGFLLFATLFAAAFKNVLKQNAGFKLQNLALLGAILFLGMFDHYFLTQQQGRLLMAFVFGLCFLKSKSDRI